MAKVQLATTFEESTVKKMKLLALEYGVNVNELIECIMAEFDADDESGQVKEILDRHAKKLKINYKG